MPEIVTKMMKNGLLWAIFPLYPLEDNKKSLALWCSHARVE